jgi:hypothetical protein
MTLLLYAIIDEVCPIFHIRDEDEIKKNQMISEGDHIFSYV